MKKSKMMGRRISGLGLALAGAMLALVAVQVQAQETSTTSTTASTDPNQIEFEKGMEALRKDNLLSAIEAFNTILSNQPLLHRARLELAVAYYRALNYEEARKEADKVLADPNIPPSVRVSILAFLAQVTRDQQQFAIKSQFTPSVSVGIMHDSNVNVGPSNDVVQIQGQTFTLTPGSVGRSDNALVVNAGVSHRYQPGKTYQIGQRTALFMWQSDASVYQREYYNLKDYNLGVVSASTGPALIVLRHWRANLAARADYIWLGGSGLALFTSLNPAITWQFNNGELTVDASLAHHGYTNFRDDSTYEQRSGMYRTMGVSLGRYLNERKVALQAGLNWLDYNAHEPRWTYRGPQAYAGVSVRSWTNGTIYGRVMYTSLKYDGLEPFYNVKRDEQERRATVGFQHTFRTGYLDKWMLNGQFMYTRNNSNVSIYDYTRRQVSLTLSRSFD